MRQELISFTATSCYDNKLDRSQWFFASCFWNLAVSLIGVQHVGDSIVQRLVQLFVQRSCLPVPLVSPDCITKFDSLKLGAFLHLLKWPQCFCSDWMRFSWTRRNQPLHTFASPQVNQPQPINTIKCTSATGCDYYGCIINTYTSWKPLSLCRVLKLYLTMVTPLDQTSRPMLWAVARAAHIHGLYGVDGCQNNKL